MQTPKSYLVSIGLLEKGSENKRGRISKAHDERIKHDVASISGLQVKGYQITGHVNTNNRSTNQENDKSVNDFPVNEKSVTKTKPTGEKTVAEISYRFAEDAFDAFEVDSGKTRSMREACRGCRCSLVGCWCASPGIVALDGTKTVQVRIVAKSKGSDI